MADLTTLSEAVLTKFKFMGDGILTLQVQHVQPTRPAGLLSILSMSAYNIEVSCCPQVEFQVGRHKSGFTNPVRAHIGCTPSSKVAWKLPTQPIRWVHAETQSALTQSCITVPRSK